MAELSRPGDLTQRGKKSNFGRHSSAGDLAQRVENCLIFSIVRRRKCSQTQNQLGNSFYNFCVSGRLSSAILTFENPVLGDLAQRAT